NGRMYIYHTTTHNNTVPKGSSIVAVSEDDGSTFRYLYDFSKLFFITVSVVEVDLAQWNGFPQDSGNGLVIFGSGTYRKSYVRLAFQPADSIEMPQSLRYFAGLDQTGMPQWSAHEKDAIPLTSQPCVGEFSVTYNQFLHKWLMLYNCDNPRGINFSTADQPWGPWSEPQVLFDPWKDGGYCHFMHVDWQFRHCDNVHDPGRENEWGGEYGPYQFEDLATGNDSTTTIYFTMSTWNPYTVVLMKSTLKLVSLPTSVEDTNLTSPARFVLWQNYPNPFNPTTSIRYELPRRVRVHLTILNLLGEEVRSLVDEFQEAGSHRVQWDGKDDKGRELSSGVYLYRLKAGGLTLVKKMVFMK
ncbi:MAG: DUF4185 domain-containing protein, partial [Calditrichaeota bacterium]